MRTKPFFRLMTLIIAMPFLIAGCTAITTVSEQIFLMSPEDEAQLGKQLAVEVEKQYPIYTKDPAATAYLQNLGQQLVKAAPPCEQSFQFKLVNSDEVNAFSIPGGYCYVNLGLLRLADNEAELASVVAHEIGHVTERHGAKTLSQSQFYTLIAQMALGQESNQLAQLAADIVESGILMQYSRENELEADQVAIYTLPRAGRDPRGIIGFFNKMQEVSPTAGTGLAGYFSSHPGTTTRIDYAKQLIQRMNLQFQDLKENSEAFAQVKKRYPYKPPQE